MAALQELDSSEKQWLEVCGQIDKLDKFFPLSAVAMSKAREAQAAAIARGGTLSAAPHLILQLSTVNVAQLLLPCPCLHASYTCLAAVFLFLKSRLHCFHSQLFVCP